MRPGMGGRAEATSHLMPREGLLDMMAKDATEHGSVAFSPFSLVVETQPRKLPSFSQFVIQMLTAGRDMLEDEPELFESDQRALGLRIAMIFIYGAMQLGCEIVGILFFTMANRRGRSRIELIICSVHALSIVLLFCVTNVVNRFRCFGLRRVIDIAGAFLMFTNVFVTLALQWFQSIEDQWHWSLGVMLGVVGAPIAALVLTGRPVQTCAAMTFLMVVSQTALIATCALTAPQQAREYTGTSSTPIGALVVLTIYGGFPLCVALVFRWQCLQHRNMCKSQAEQHKVLTTFRASTQWLLFSMVPPRKVKQLPNVSPESWYSSAFDEYHCTVLQMDVSGFTNLSAKLKSSELVELIQALFTAVDYSAQCIGNVWKVELIGDCYKAMVGGPIPCEDHALKGTALALAIVDICSSIARRLNVPLSVRVGVHTGDVTAAVVGVRMPRYLTFGRDCEVLNHLERGADANSVFISEDTARGLQMSPLHLNRTITLPDGSEIRGHCCGAGEGDLLSHVRGTCRFPELDDFLRDLQEAAAEIPATPETASAEPGPEEAELVASSLEDGSIVGVEGKGELGGEQDDEERSLGSAIQDISATTRRLRFNQPSRSEVAEMRNMTVLDGEVRAWARTQSRPRGLRGARELLVGGSESRVQGGLTASDPGKVELPMLPPRRLGTEEDARISRPGSASGAGRGGWRSSSKAFRATMSSSPLSRSTSTYSLRDGGGRQSSQLSLVGDVITMREEGAVEGKGGSTQHSVSQKSEETAFSFSHSDVILPSSGQLSKNGPEKAVTRHSSVEEVATKAITPELLEKRRRAMRDESDCDFVLPVKQRGLSSGTASREGGRSDTATSDTYAVSEERARESMDRVSESASRRKSAEHVRGAGVLSTPEGSSEEGDSSTVGVIVVEDPAANSSKARPGGVTGRKGGPPAGSGHAGAPVAVSASLGSVQMPAGGGLRPVSERVASGGDSVGEGHLSSAITASTRMRRQISFPEKETSEDGRANGSAVLLDMVEAQSRVPATSVSFQKHIAGMFLAAIALSAALQAALCLALSLSNSVEGMRWEAALEDNAVVLPCAALLLLAGPLLSLRLSHAQWQTGWPQACASAALLVAALALENGAKGRHLTRWTALLGGFLGVLIQCATAKLQSWRWLLWEVAYLGLVLGVFLWVDQTHEHPFEVRSRESHPWWRELLMGWNFVSGGVLFVVPLALSAAAIVDLQSKARDLLCSTKRQLELESKLLDALVPSGVTARLLRGDHLVADEIEEGTAMFAYIDEFEDMVLKHGAGACIAWINRIFRRLDGKVAEARSITKVETFNSFSLLYSTNPDTHVQDCLRLATAMLRAVALERRPDGKPTKLKVGISSGPFTAGLIGLQSPRYSIFGDTVNTASRMASSAIPCTIDNPFIHLSPSSRKLVGDPDGLLSVLGRGLVLSEHGNTNVKGKGVMRTHALSVPSLLAPHPSAPPQGS